VQFRVGTITGNGGPYSQCAVTVDYIIHLNWGLAPMSRVFVDQVALRLC